MKMTPLYPLKFEPILVSKVWGGRRLAQWGKKLPQDQKIGESWEVSDRRGARSIIANGPLRGHTLHELVIKRGPELLGEEVARNFPDRFPLLIKLIHARRDLSIQVHPDSEKARLFSGEPNGKTEAWYILEARPNARMIYGLKRSVTKEQLEKAIEENRVPQVARRVSVQKGDCLFVKPGTVHTIGAGILLAEVQENSDTTYRLFDWQRKQTKKRKLHIKESLGSIDFADQQPLVKRANAASHRKLACCEHFCMELHHGHFESSIEQFQGITVVAGRGKILYGDKLKETCPIRRGETLVIPASLKRYAVTGGDQLELLLWGSNRMPR